jgi:hypothetical protein
MTVRYATGPTQCSARVVSLRLSGGNKRCQSCGALTRTGVALAGRTPRLAGPTFELAVFLSG